MKQFHTIEKIDTGILYTLELASSISILLLAFGLIASMANVLTNGSALTDNLLMQYIWAWTQCIAIDASVAGTIIRTFRYHAEGERVKTWLSGFLSALLLFTAAIVSNIESVQQTLNIALDQHTCMCLFLWKPSSGYAPSRLCCSLSPMRYAMFIASAPRYNTLQGQLRHLYPSWCHLNCWMRSARC